MPYQQIYQGITFVFFVCLQNVDPLSPAVSPYLRASYSLAPVEKFDVAFERLAELIREEQEAENNNNNKKVAAAELVWIEC